MKESKIKTVSQNCLVTLKLRIVIFRFTSIPVSLKALEIVG